MASSVTELDAIRDEQVRPHVSQVGVWRGWRRLSDNDLSLLCDEPWPRRRVVVPRIYSLHCSTPLFKRPELLTLRLHVLRFTRNSSSYLLRWSPACRFAPVVSWSYNSCFGIRVSDMRQAGAHQRNQLRSRMSSLPEMPYFYQCSGKRVRQLKKT